MCLGPWPGDHEDGLDRRLGPRGTNSVESLLRSTLNMLAVPLFLSPLTSARRVLDACSAFDPFGFAVSPSPFIPSITIAMISLLALLTALAGNDVDPFSLFLLSPPCGPSCEKLHAAA